MFKIIVYVKTQSADLFEDDKKVWTFKVSTAQKGLGTEKGSYKTPTGLFRIAEKIGSAAPLGTIFRGRKDTGEKWENSPAEEDLILTRILWLEGLEAHNANTRERFIYFHGTNQEELLGTPASHGCIRMSNKDVVVLFDKVPVGTVVEIVP